MRIVRAASGAVTVDAQGRSSGRGTYVHPSGECIERAATTGAIARGLRTTLDQSEAGRLVGELQRSLGGTG